VDFAALFTITACATWLSRYGPSQELVAAVVAMKQRDPTWGWPRIAQQIAVASIPLNKDVVRRILAARDKPTPAAPGPSWLTMLGHETGAPD